MSMNYVGENGPWEWFAGNREGSSKTDLRCLLLCFVRGLSKTDLRCRKSVLMVKRQECVTWNVPARTSRAVVPSESALET